MSTALLSNLEKTVLQTRPDLRELFSGDVLAFQGWLLIHGIKEYQGLSEEYRARQASILKNVSERNLIEGPSVSGLTRFMEFVWNVRSDLQALFEIDTQYGQKQLIKWFYYHGLDEWELVDFLPIEHIEWLVGPIDNQIDNAYIPNLAQILWDCDENLQAAFHDSNSIDFSEWVATHGQDSMKILPKLVNALNKETSVSRLSTTQTQTQRPRGFNLIGYARGQLGIGEDVRMAALAMESAGIPYIIYNIEPGNEVDQNEHSFDSKCSDELIYDTNLFCLTGIENARLFAIYGKVLHEGFTNIGYWPWELENWPEQWLHAYEHMNEIWASSYFAYQAYLKTAPCKVRHMPMAVDVTPTAELTRKDFGLEEDAFLYVFSFDFLSSLSRKNPMACVKAFLKAFPQKQFKNVGLVIKCMRLDKNSKQWGKLSKLISGDNRISLITETLTRGEVLDLYRMTDCFVSLHRSEGFGRGLADAMALKRPVICTGYSGNMDFTTPASAALVDYTFASADSYPFGDGQIWADPTVEDAISQMQRIYSDDKWRAKISKTAQKVMRHGFSPASIGKNYLQYFKNQTRFKSS